MANSKILLLSIFTWAACVYSALAQDKQNIQYDSTDLQMDNTGWEEGNIIPNFKFTDVKGHHYVMHDLPDKVTIIDFWFIACKPCIANKRYLKLFHRQYGVNIISVSIDERSSTVRRYAEDNDMRWINVHDNTGYGNHFLNQICKNKPGDDGNSYPDYILIMPDKTIAKYYTGGDDIKKMGVELQRYFAQTGMEKG